MTARDDLRALMDHLDDEDAAEVLAYALQWLMTLASATVNGPRGSAVRASGLSVQPLTW